MKGSIRDPFEVLKTARVVAVVGASRNPEKDAYKVPEYLNKAGYRIIPVNPSAEEILGEKAYPSLDDIPDEIAREVDVVDVFRPPREALAVAEQAVRLARRTGRRIVVWFQKGTASEEAVKKLLEEGLDVVVDRCMMEEHRRMTGGGQA
ncbi:CoA-binding protein [Aeropyrum camini]|uniref:Predicted CoA-binding protein n=1 Tax=Aeropyrum camini SY1 = JCM 12091 TaxID=1198449 RepID=U3TGP1_9CREN|nr:CoA-binding protein [Aeropyrum camini]BAN90509.1 predicted CoA-binding protein [Aeropyrum camini SY1 = JCM 12091]